jgi:hypothetical protein
VPEAPRHGANRHPGRKRLGRDEVPQIVQPTLHAVALPEPTETLRPRVGMQRLLIDRREEPAVIGERRGTRERLIARVVRGEDSER